MMLYLTLSSNKKTLCFLLETFIKVYSITNNPSRNKSLGLIDAFFSPILTTPVLKGTIFLVYLKFFNLVLVKNQSQLRL